MTRFIEKLHCGDKSIGIIAAALVAATFLPSPAFADKCSAVYDRSCYAHWSDLDGDGQDTRQEMLERDSLVPVTKDDRGRVIGGLWVSPYDGKVHRDPGALDLDHVIALGHIHRIGGQRMDAVEREAIANDPDNLVLVTAGSNRQKSDHSGARWVIPNLAWLNEFLDRQHKVRVKYRLGYEPCEYTAILFQRWIADRATKGVRLFRADNYADTLRGLLADGLIARTYKRWLQCREAIQ